MQGGLGEILPLIPASVRSSILADASCKEVWFCVPPSHEVISVDDLRSSPSSAFASKVDTTEWQLVYDVMRVHHGGVMFERDHVRRIYESSVFAVSSKPLSNKAKLRFPVETVTESIRRYISNQHEGKGDINLKFLAWLPSSSNSLGNEAEWQKLLCDIPYALYFVKSFFPPDTWYAEGTRLALLYNAQRHTPNAKIVQAPLRLRAKELQESSAAYEVLLVWDKAAHYLVPEGSRSNYLLITKDDRLLCSLEENILSGITLRAVKRAATAAGLTSIEHCPLYVGDLCTAKAIAMLGTSPGVLPVREIQMYYDEESKLNFISALDEYEQCGKGRGGSLLLQREKILSNGGLLELHSAQNMTLEQLREAYNAEAFH
ncbi:protein G6 [Trypanosoma rangeli]|uniref:Protein G6 n=1 Tax=Trypanosoma rangeli TaxID=5698 RepID=A0A3R7NT31_TRYRA|nr:protein G6 [Trypanosoma rangeli]RNF11183.1 protein G6 [Trypanosoma rangeli]|eukprot:RNF11183.1 protein G6 [Trypanosoma rangeli]